MNADGTDLVLLDHAVSGDFTPTIASDGRLVFTRWDHLQRDQQNDEGREPYGAFNYVSEAGTQALASNAEIFPELRTVPSGSYVHGHVFNFFFPWQVNEDGTKLETINHVGRHELVGYFDSPHDGLPEFIAPQNRRTADLLLQLQEDPLRAGLLLRHHRAGVRHACRRADHRPQRAREPQRRRHAGRLHHQPGECRPGARRADAAGQLPGPLPQSAAALRRLADRRPHRSPFADRQANRRAVVALRLPPRADAAGRAVRARRPAADPERHQQVDLVLGQPELHAARYNGPLWELDPVEVAHARGRLGTARRCRRSRRRSSPTSSAALPASTGCAASSRPRPGADRQPQRHPPRRPPAGFQPAHRRHRDADRSARRDADRHRLSAALPGRPGPRVQRTSTAAGGSSPSSCTTASTRRSPAPRRAPCASATTAAWRRSSRRGAPPPGSWPAPTAAPWCASATGSPSRRARCACAATATASIAPTSYSASRRRPIRPRRCATWRAGGAPTSTTTARRPPPYAGRHGHIDPDTDADATGGDRQPDADRERAPRTATPRRPRRAGRAPRLDPIACPDRRRRHPRR